MKHLFLLSLLLLTLQAMAQEGGNSKDIAKLSNEIVALNFNKETGFFTISDVKSGEILVDKAYFQISGLQSKDPCEKRTHNIIDIRDELGSGKSLTIRVHFNNYADLIWKANIYDNQSFVIFSVGVENDSQIPITLTQFYPLASANVFEGLDNNVNYKVLDGNSGGNVSKVRTANTNRSFNNIMLRFGAANETSILVAGGLTYNEFDKFIEIDRGDKKFNLKMFAEDPVGKLIDANSSYYPKESFYLDLHGENPFTALENYGLTVRKAQKITLSYYDFPTECLWYASTYNLDKSRDKFNDSKGAVDEMDYAIKSGITKYTRVAMRLVPDNYEHNNQQGWWDDEHWAMYGEKWSTINPHYVEPYLTTKSWCQEVEKRGGIPMTYFQSSRRSEDFIKLHPDYMLFNDPYRIKSEFPYRLIKNCELGPESNWEYVRHWWYDRPLEIKHMYSYDFTDPKFGKHMEKVYKNLSDAGIKGIMYDYPEITSWAYEGGFENKYATTSGTYRKMFQFAYDGLGTDCYLDERNLCRGSDITLGLVASQRVWGDTDQFIPEMVNRAGLRWYKNRVVVNYDLDSKDPSNSKLTEHMDGVKTMMTMAYVISGRFLLGRSFSQLTKEQMHILSRTFPYHTTPKSARPIDAFTSNSSEPHIFDYEVNLDWHQLTFYNPNDTAALNLNVTPAKSLNEGGLGMDESKAYHVYDFWNDNYIGKIQGTSAIDQNLRPGETRMMSIHTVENNPQFISTNRHIMQGMLDLTDCKWNSKKKKLTGTSKVIGGDQYVVVIANNGHKAVKASVSSGKSKLIEVSPEIIHLSIDVEENQDITWMVSFK